MRRPDGPQLASPEPVAPGTGLTIRAALFVGLALTLGLWLLAANRVTRRIAEVEGKATAINARYMRAQDLLSNVRTQTLLGSVFVRDALLDPGLNSAALDRERFEDTYRAADRALRQYVPVLDSQAERDGIEGLRHEIEDFRRAMLEVLGTDSAKWPKDARFLLQQRVVPKRDVVIRVSEQVQAMNRNAFLAQNSATAQVYRDAQRQTWQRLGIALAASLAIGLWAALYAGRLESRLQQQRRRDRQMTDDLHRLSARIVSAQEDERRMIARELHDEVGQALAAIRVELAYAQRAEEGSAAAAARLAEVRTITEGALHTIRDLSHLLHPAMLDELGLAAALAALVRAFGLRHNVNVEFVHDQLDARFVPELETSVYRIVQEALNNVAKHARATTCRVQLQRLPGEVRVTIEDNGVGFDAADADGNWPRGLGLIGIRERATQLGGTLRVDSAPGEGTRLSVELPARVRAEIAPDDIPAGEPRQETLHEAPAHLSR